jgi:Ca-activated chloride channel homolog
MVTITFENPLYLWFLLAVPFLVVTHFFLLRHAKRKAMKFANFVALKRVTGERLITKNYTVLALRILVIICAILGVAQTTLWYEGETNTNAYVLAIDSSASMKAEDFLPTRLDAAKLYAQGFIDETSGGTQVGLVSFSGVTFIEQTLTTDRDQVRDSLAALEATASGTDIPGAIITSANMLSATDQGRVIILITDGSNTIEDFTSKGIQRAVKYANYHHVKVHTIGVGKTVETPVGYLPKYYNVSATYDANNLQYIANATGGKYYYAADPVELQGAYNDIRQSDTTNQVRVNLTSGLVLTCLVLIILEWGLLSTRFRTLP